MCPPTLTPEVAQYLGPAFTPVAAGLWAVIGYPLCSFCLLIWDGINAGGAYHGLAEAVGGLLIVALGIVMLVAGALVVAFLVGASVLFVLCGLAVFISLRRPARHRPAGR
jgi:hypothetical protein